MSRYELGDILLIDFPQTSQDVHKRRPTLVILDIGDDDLVLAPITSRRRSSVGDYELKDWAEAGLLRPSWVRLAKVGCLEKKGIVRVLGQLSAEDRSTILAGWNQTYRGRR